MAVDSSSIVRESRQLDMLGSSLAPTGVTDFADDPRQVDPSFEVAGGEGIAGAIARTLLRPLVGSRVVQVGAKLSALERASAEAAKLAERELSERLDGVRTNAPRLTPSTSEVGQNVFIADPEDLGRRSPNSIGFLVGIDVETGGAHVQFEDPRTNKVKVEEIPLSGLHAAPYEIVGEDASADSARAFFGNLQAEDYANFISAAENKPPELVRVETGEVRKTVDADGKVTEVPIHRNEYQFVMPSDEAANATLRAVHDIQKRDELYSTFTAFNPDTINATPNIFALIEQQARNYAPLIEAQTRGVVTLKAQRELADILGYDAQSLANRLLKRAPGDLGGWTPERTIAARDFLVVATERLDELARIVSAQGGGDQALLNFKQFQVFHAHLQAAVLGLRAEAGRLLGSWRVQAQRQQERQDVSIPAQFIGRNLPETPMSQMEIHDSLEGYGGAAEVLAQVDLYLKSPTLTARAKMVREMNRRGVVGGVFDALHEAWIQFLFSNPQSHVKNIVGTFYTTTSAIPERFFAGTVGKTIRRGLTSVGMSQRGVDEVYPEEAQDMLFAWFMTQKDALKAAALTARTGEQEIGGSRLEIYGPQGRRGRGTTAYGRTKPWSADAFNVNPQGVLGHTIDISGHIFTGGRLPTNMLSAEDMYFKAIGQRMELYAQAARLSRRLGLDGDDRADFMAAFITNPETGEWGSYKFADLGGSDILKKTHEEARYLALQRELQEVGKAVRTIARLPLIRYIMPVITTPINSFLYAVRDRTPFALASKEWRDTVAKGGADADMALGRLSYATALIGTFAMLGWMQLVTGPGPSNPKERRAWSLAGNRPFTIKIGGKQVSYRWFEPVSTMVGVGYEIPKLLSERLPDVWDALNNDENSVSADMARISAMMEMVETGYVKEKDWEAFVAAMALHMSQNVTSATYMSGFSRILHALDDPNRYGPAALRGLARTLIPRGVGQFALSSDGDGVRRRVDSLLQAVQSQIPGWREDLRPQIDFLGRSTPLNVIGGDGILNKWINPLHYSIPDYSDPVIKVMEDWQATPTDWPDQWQKVTLSDDQVYITRIFAGKMFQAWGNAYASGEKVTLPIVESNRGGGFSEVETEVNAARGLYTGKTFQELARIGAREGIASDLQKIRDFAWAHAMVQLRRIETDNGKLSWDLEDQVSRAHTLRMVEHGGQEELTEKAGGTGEQSERVRNNLEALGLMGN